MSTGNGQPTYSVTLSYQECFSAALLGVRRRLRSLGHHNKDCYAWSDGSSWWDRDIEGAGGEKAAGQILDLECIAHAGDFDCADLASGVEVRTTKLLNGHLIIRPGDKDGNYVLVTGSMPTYNVIGWISSEHVRKHFALSQGPGGYGELAYWVKQDELWPLSELISKETK